MSYDMLLTAFFLSIKWLNGSMYLHYEESILSCMIECCVIFLLFLTFYVLTVSHCTKKLHLFLITWDGNLDNLNCRAWARPFWSGNLELLCPLSVKLYVWTHRTAVLCYFCRVTVIHITKLQGNSMEHAYFWLGTSLILTKESKKGKTSLMSWCLSRFLSVSYQLGNRHEELCIQHQYMFVLLYFLSKTTDVRFERPPDQVKCWSSISISMLK